MRKPSEWILADDDSHQHVRKLDENTFELIELCIISRNPDLYEVYSDTVHLPDFSDEEISGILNSFGYSSSLQVKEEYGAGTNQIIAECAFEYYGSFGLEPLARGVTEEAAREYIDVHIRKLNGGIA